MQQQREDNREHDLTLGLLQGWGIVGGESVWQDWLEFSAGQDSRCLPANAKTITSFRRWLEIPLGLCSRCGQQRRIQYDCCQGNEEAEHHFCYRCFNELNNSEVGLNCPFDGSALAS